MRFKLYLLPFCLFLLTGAFAQTDSVSHAGYPFGLTPPSYFHRSHGYKFARTERTLGVILGYRGLHSHSLEAGIGHGKFWFGEGGLGGSGINAVVEWMPAEQVVGPQLQLWTAGWGFFLGADLTASAIQYIGPGENTFALRGEVGYSIAFLHLNYNRTFQFGANRDYLPKNQFGIRVYLPFYPKR